MLPSSCSLLWCQCSTIMAGDTGATHTLVIFAGGLASMSSCLLWITVCVWVGCFHKSEMHLVCPLQNTSGLRHAERTLMDTSFFWYNTVSGHLGTFSHDAAHLVSCDLHLEHPLPICLLPIIFSHIYSNYVLTSVIHTGPVNINSMYILTLHRKTRPI